jgi:hypothetical protein
VIYQVNDEAVWRNGDENWLEPNHHPPNRYGTWCNILTSL